MESLLAWAKEIIEEGHGPPLSVVASDVLALAQRVEDAEQENERLREGLERIATPELDSIPGVNPDRAVSTSTMRQLLARQVLWQEKRESASEESSDE